MRRAFLILTALLVATPTALVYRWWTGPAAADPQPATCLEGAVATHPASAEAAALLEVARAADDGSGITAAVVIDGELVFAAAVAPADITPAVGPNSRFRTGSVAKLFTAVAAARLAEQGQLDLRQGIAEWVPEIPRGDITPYHLATHTAGIRHYDFGNMAEANNQTRYSSPDDALDLFATDPLLDEPGAAFHYTSHGYNALGVVVARAFGAPYEIALRDLLAAPLGLESLAVDDVAAGTACRTRFNTLVFGSIPLPAPWRDNSDLYPSGGLVISAADLARFADAVYRGDFLTAESVQLLTAPAVSAAGETRSYGFGTERGLSEDGSVEWYGHGGEINGAYASVRYYPASQMTIAAMTNYNYWLTDKRLAFFPTIGDALPELFRPSPGDSLSADSGPITDSP